MSRNENIIRILLAAVITILIWTAIFIFLPQKGMLVSFGYSFGLLGMVEFFGTLLLWARGGKGKYLTNVAFPLHSKVYLFANILLTVIIVSLHFFGIWTMPVKLFIVLHFLLLGIFLWQLLSMDAGQEKIEEVGRKVDEQSCDWKMFRADADALMDNVSNEFQKDVSAVRDAIRYADPMTPSELKGMDDEIRSQFFALKAAISQKDSKSTHALAVDLQEKIRERGNKLKALK